MGKIIKTFSISFIILTIILSGTFLALRLFRSEPSEFDGERAYKNVQYQVALGPRTIGSTAHEEAAKRITNELQKADWQVEEQDTVISGYPVKNIIAKRGSGEPWVILGSHYDSRNVADRDPIQANRGLPVPGANDGASSTAILLELARVLPKRLNKEVWLVFFDAEDNGDASGANWDIGSNYFVSQLAAKPDDVVILDMVGDQNLDIYMETNSDRELNEEIWSVARESGYLQFIPSYKYALIDDHIPFINADIKAIDVIDFDYPYWHTTNDTVDKISPTSLKVVGETILTWLENKTR